MLERISLQRCQPLFVKLESDALFEVLPILPDFEPLGLPCPRVELQF
jgi:hypothetical protein